MSKNLQQRIIAALILIPLVIAAVNYGGVIFSVLLVGAGMLMAYEWVRLLHVDKKQFEFGALACAILLTFSAVHMFPFIHIVNFLLYFLIFFIAFFALLKLRFTPFAGGMLYILWPLLTLFWIREKEFGFWMVLYILVIVWATDVVAMLCGKTIGGIRLAPKISPGKTWAGLIGGVMGAMLAGGAFYGVMHHFIPTMPFSLFPFMMLAGVLAVIEQLADLFESHIKRKYGMKDSGALIPGHGGILDRVDGLIGVIMAVSLLLIIRAYQMPSIDAAHALWIW